MSPQARTGLLAFGIVGGGFLALAAVVGVLALGRADRATGPGKVTTEGPASTGNPDDDVSYIVGHRWWRKAPTRDGLEGVARLIVGEKNGRTVYVGEDGYATPDRFVGTGDSLRENPKLSARQLAVECDWATRPTREQALRKLRDELDRAEYRQGRGR